MKTFRNIFALLGTIGLLGGAIEGKGHAIFIGLFMIAGAVAIHINETKKNEKRR